jgi:glutamate-1-semialdehyde 2,1-aminomutase
MFTFFWRGTPPENFTEVTRSDTALFKKTFRALLKAGIYTPPSAFEASFLSAAHTPAILEKTLDAYGRI